MKIRSPHIVIRDLFQRFPVSETLRKVILNTGWLFIDKLVRILFGIVVSIWVARYLGPEDFGILSYALAIFNLLIPVAGLGLESIIIRNLARHDRPPSEVLGTAFGLKLIASLGTLLIAVPFILMLETDRATQLTVLIVVTGLIFHSFHVIDYWFQSLIASKFVVGARIAALSLSALLKIVFIILELSVIYFALSVLVETVLFAIGLLFVYYKTNGSTNTWTFSRDTGKVNVKESWTLILAALPAAIYLRIDQIMLGRMAGQDEVGIYAVAVMITESFYFIPVIIVSSILPALVRFHSHEPVKFRKTVSDYIKASTWFSALIIVVCILLSERIFLWLYGTEYHESAQVFTVHILSLLSVFIGFFFSKICIVLNRTYVNLLAAMSTAIVNIILNLVFIPYWGALGAAAATSISYTLRFIIPLHLSEIRSIIFRQKNMVYPMLVSIGTIALLFYLQDKLLLQLSIAIPFFLIGGLHLVRVFQPYIGKQNEL
jgi:O-antigen/teichoic acid export membrane protein